MNPDPLVQSGINVDMSNEQTLYNWRTEWVPNIVENLKRFSYFNKERAVKVWANENQNNPCVIVGAGPSLEGNIDTLKECAPRKIALFASAHSCMYLAKKGIKPDFICILDAGAQWVPYLEDFAAEGLPLIADWGVNPAYFDAWKGPVYFYQSEFDRFNSAQGKLLWNEILAKTNGAIPPTPVPVGGHVVGGMFYLAKQLFASSDIVFVGCDYSFSPEDKFYPGALEIDKPSTPTDLIGTACDILGRTVKVPAAYSMFKSVMDASVVEAKRRFPESLFVNATEGGVMGAYPQGLLKDFEYVTLPDALELVCNKRSLN